MESYFLNEAIGFTLHSSALLKKNADSSNTQEDIAHGTNVTSDLIALDFMKIKMTALQSALPQLCLHELNVNRNFCVEDLGLSSLTTLDCHTIVLLLCTLLESYIRVWELHKVTSLQDEFKVAFDVAYDKLNAFLREKLKEEPEMNYIVHLLDDLLIFCELGNSLRNFVKFLKPLCKNSLDEETLCLLNTLEILH